MYDFGVPPESTFSTPEEAHVAINAFARDHGYDVIRLRAYCDKKSNCRRVFFACDRQGVYKPSKPQPGTNDVQEDLQKGATVQCASTLFVDRQMECGALNILEPREVTTMKDQENPHLILLTAAWIGPPT
ncbi:unnamed protein product, partial [Aphanomyces euteiches]